MDWGVFGAKGPKKSPKDKMNEIVSQLNIVSSSIETATEIARNVRADDAIEQLGIINDNISKIVDFYTKPIDDQGTGAEKILDKKDVDITNGIEVNYIRTSVIQQISEISKKAQGFYGEGKEKEFDEVFTTLDRLRSIVKGGRVKS